MILCDAFVITKNISQWKNVFWIHFIPFMDSESLLKKINLHQSYLTTFSHKEKTFQIILERLRKYDISRFSARTLCSSIEIYNIKVSIDIHAYICCLGSCDYYMKILEGNLSVWYFRSIFKTIWNFFSRSLYFKLSKFIPNKFSTIIRVIMHCSNWWVEDFN